MGQPLAPAEPAEEVVPAPQVGESEPAPLEPTEVESGAEQESAEPTEQPVDLKAVLDEIGAEDPEIVAKLKEALAPEDLDEERLQFYQEQAWNDRNQHLQYLASQAQAPAPLPAPVTQKIASTFQQLAREIDTRATKLKSGDYDPEKGEGATSLIGDGTVLAQWVMNEVAQAMPPDAGTYSQWAVAQSAASMLQTLESHPAHKFLTPQERQSITQGQASMEDILWMHLNAAARNADKIGEAVKAQENEKVETSAEKLLKALKAYGPRNGNLAPTVASGNKTYANMTDEERAKLTPEQIDAMTAKFLRGQT